MKPVDPRHLSLRIAGGTAGLLGLAVTAMRFARISPWTVFYLSVSAAVCAIDAAVVAIVRIVASRSPEVRRMAAGPMSTTAMQCWRDRHVALSPGRPTACLDGPTPCRVRHADSPGSQATFDLAATAR